MGGRRAPWRLSRDSALHVVVSPRERSGGAHLSLPQKVHVYFECCETSIFLMTLRMEAPYRVPYLPVMPTFFVRLPLVSGSGVG